MTSDTTIRIPSPNYLLFDTERNDLPAVVVLNDSILAFEHPDIFPWHLEIVIQIAKAGNNGMPTPAESKLLDQLGDTIEALLQTARTGHDSTNVLFLARVTCDSQRELLFRVHDPELANSVLEGSLARLRHREWSYSMFRDGDWSAVKMFRDLRDSAT